jgi:hypothetical protein
MARSGRLDGAALERLLHLQDNVVTRRQASGCGMTPGALRHRMRPDGPWQQLLPGVYLAATGTPSRRQEEIAALLYAGPASTLTGLAALHHHGVRAPEHDTITVLVPAQQARDSRAFVRIWPTTRMPRLICCDGAIKFARVARALTDAARELGEFRAVRAVVADAVQRRCCRIEWLTEELSQAPRRHSGSLRRALAEVTEGIRSAAEGDLRDLIIRARLPLPMFNASLYAGTELVAIADAWWPGAGVAVEVDSREWHLSPEDWERTMRRHSSLSKRGILVLHFTPNQIRHKPGWVAAEIRAALAAGRPQGTLGITAVPAAG